MLLEAGEILRLFFVGFVEVEVQMWGPFPTLLSLLPSCSPGSERRTRCHPLIVLSRRLIGFGGLITSEGREGALPLWRPGLVRTNQG